MAKRIRILHSEAKHYCAKARLILKSFADVDYADLRRPQLLKKVASYDALIIRLNNAVDREVLERGKNLKALATPTTGTNHLDEVFAAKKGVSVISLKGERKFLNSISSTAEHTFGLLLSLMRRIPVAQYSVLSGQWARERFLGHELSGKTIGIIGFGRLGRMVARYADTFGMNVLANEIDRDVTPPVYVKFCSLEALLKKSDVVTVHVPLNDKTKNLLDARQLRLMKKGAVLLNTARGALVDEREVVRLLRKKHLAGFAGDVLAGEEKPNFKVLNAALVRYARTHSNVVITPHIGGAAIEAIDKTDIFIAQKLKKFFKG